MAYSVALAGGGGRTAWALGVLSELGLLAPHEWAGVSAGAAMAVFAATGRLDETMAYFLARAAENRGNVHWTGPLRGRPMFPHEPMYRATVEHALADGGFERLRAGPPVRVLLSWIEPGEPRLRRAGGALRAYNQRKRAGVIHAPDDSPRGFGWSVFTASESPDPQTVVDRIIDTSATWPVTRLRKHEGRTYVDGGLVENVPVRALSPAAQAGRVLVLLSRPTPTPPATATRLYLAPETPVPLPKWDYASPDKLEATFEQGRAAGRAERARVEDFLAR